MEFRLWPQRLCFASYVESLPWTRAGAGQPPWLRAGVNVNCAHAYANRALRAWMRQQLLPKRLRRVGSSGGSRQETQETNQGEPLRSQMNQEMREHYRTGLEYENSVSQSQVITTIGSFQRPSVLRHLELSCVPYEVGHCVTLHR